MTHYQVTVDGELLQQLFARDEGLVRLVEHVLNQVCEAQASEQLGAGPYERSAERRGYRNGHRERKLTTRIGTLELKVPQFREGQFSTEMFARYQRSEQALLLAMMEMVVNGVSTRKVERITEELCGTSFSKSTVSELCKQLDPLVQGWNDRDLSGMSYPFLLVDALVIKVRKDGRVRPQSLLVAVGVNATGYREVLGIRLGDTETEAGWSDFFAWLKERGLSGVDLVVSDHHAGLVKAIQRHFQGASWQRCQTHFMRNILDAAPKALQDELHMQIRAIFDAPDEATARQLLRQVLDRYEARAPQALERLESGFDDAIAVLALPARYRKRLRTTNGMERLNVEIRRRERVIRIFPNEESAMRLLGALLMEQDEQWSTGWRYFDMTEYHEWRAQRARAETRAETAETVAA